MKKMYTTFLGAMLLSLGLHAQIVNIPDANFKAYLVGNPAINTNGDTEIQFSEATAFTGTINVPNMNISSLEGIEAFLNFSQLYCNNNQINGVLDLSNRPNLTVVWCSDNNLTQLILANNLSLLDVRCAFNNLINLDLTSCSALSLLWCNHNQLSTLDLMVSANLTTLYCHANQLINLNLTQSSSLTQLLCYENQLTSLDVSNNPALTQLNLASNQISSLNLSNNPALNQLICNHNELTSLNVSANSNLTRLRCHANQLTSLNVANGNNTAISASIDFVAYLNPNLSCIQVDDATWSTANWSNIDATASFSEDCSTSSGPCSIDVSIVEITACDPSTNTYSVTLELIYENEPSSGLIGVANETFPINGSPQTETISNLSANGDFFSASAWFIDEPSCFLNFGWNSPMPCNISVTESFTPFQQTLGTPSATQSFTVNGFDLTQDLVINAPTHFELYHSSNGFWSNSVTLMNQGGMASGTIDVRLNAPLVGNHSSEIQLESGISFLEIQVVGETTDGTAGLDDMNNKANLTIYPNPASDQLTIELSQPTDIYIMDALGNIVYSANSMVSQTIDVAHFAQGVYFVKVGNATQRFVKQ